METQKQLETPLEPEAEAEGANEVRAKPRKPGEPGDAEAGDTEQLTIDENLDSGDPYNSTGSHVILELRKYAGE